MKEGPKSTGSPGGARKIILTIRLLQRLGHEVFLLDSSHSSNSDGLFSEANIASKHIGHQEICVITPPLWRNRKVGKALQAFGAPKIARRQAHLHKFDLVVIYNAYLFEVRVAQTLLRERSIPFILQLEDLPLARRRGVFNIKPAIENALFAATCKSAALILCVSSAVSSFARKYNDQLALYPPIIDPRIEDYFQTRPNPFSTSNINIGYFGGLNSEKGAHKILKLAQLLDSPYIVHVSGKGDLADQFKDLAKRYPHRVIYHGFVTDERLFALLCTMDILVNPHDTSREFHQGVFPFKLYEYIASGSYVITSKLPGAEADQLGGLCYFDGSVEGLLEKIKAAPSDYSERNQRQLRETVQSIASFSTMKERVGGAISRILLSRDRSGGAC